ncbi:hypothetical protein HMPREF3226_02074 [Prevotella corporis]|uniref:Uncharacterized protein n=1 Tax=Prevotella corporis TaxID=28128 RepID=A0A133PYR4_9BACT|nr:hypothetical protein HMPREF3226_02074 [Prevotella corporis]
MFYNTKGHLSPPHSLPFILRLISIENNNCQLTQTLKNNTL